jgi:hypothetical protein
MNPLLILAILFLPSVIVLFTAFVTYDSLVEFEYENDREAWVADGQPRGMFWNAPDAGLFQGNFTRYRLQILLIFRTPAWAIQSPAILKVLKRYRFCVIYWNASLPIFFGLLVYLQK